jgi:hypothetical protein
MQNQHATEGNPAPCNIILQMTAMFKDEEISRLRAKTF